VSSARILATGRAVPPRRVTNADLEALLGESVDDWLVQHVGIRARHFMSDEQATSDLAAEAAAQALGRAGVAAGDVDLLVVATDTPDSPSPATASVVQARLGAHRAGVLDVNAACAGWVTALDLASKQIACDARYRHVLVVGAYGMSRFLDWKDKRTCTLFADGAGAVLLGAGAEPGFLGARLAAASEYHDALGIYSGGTRRPATADEVAAHGPPVVRFVRRFPATFNVDRWPGLIREVLEPAGLALGDVDLYVFTQLNLRTIEATMAALGQPMSRTHTTMDRWGYTGSACIPMTLDDAVLEGRLRPGDHVLFCASGGGLAMAAALYRWTAPPGGEGG
jgi:3-oxoacyl-[acyl-carrier-protein] synthase III